MIVSYCSTQSSNFPIQNNKTGNKELNLLENKASRSHGRILYENCTLPEKIGRFTHVTLFLCTFIHKYLQDYHYWRKGTCKMYIILVLQ